VYRPRCFLSAACFTITLEAVEKLAGIGEDRSEDLLGNADKIIILGCVGLAINLGGMVIFGGVLYLVTHVCTSTSLHGHVSEQTCVLQDTVTPTDLVNVNTPMAATVMLSTQRENATGTATLNATNIATPTATHTATHTATIWSWGKLVMITDTGTDADKGTSPR
jgi:hypothetical protein